MLQFLVDGQMCEKVEESVMKDTKYELIVVIANHGYSEMVMEAAREKGRRRRNGDPCEGDRAGKGGKNSWECPLRTRRKSSISWPKTVDKNAIMKSIMDNAGINSKAKSVVFSLPVTDNGRTAAAGNPVTVPAAGAGNWRRGPGNFAEERKDQADRREAHGML